MSCFVIYSVGDMKIIKGGKNIISDGLNWVGVEFFVNGDIG